MKILNYLIFFLPLGGCQLAVNDRVSLENFSFDTTDPSELFFKNVRQSDYDLEERTEAKMNVFRLAGENRDSVGLYPVIIHHWALDKAYLWLEPGSALPKEFDVVITTAEGSMTFTFDGTSPKNHIQVATGIFHGLLDDARISIGETELIPIGSPARANFRIIANDYYRLVELK